MSMTLIDPDGRRQQGCGRGQRAPVAGGGRARHLALQDAHDDTLLTMVREGDDDALTALYQRHYPDALRYARRLSSRSLGAQAADDVAAEAVRKVLAAMRGGRGPIDGFRQYLFTAVRSVACTNARGAGRDQPLDELPDTAQPTPDDTAVDLLVALAALASLPERWRSVLWAAHVSDLTPHEIAPLLGLRPNAVSALAARAREALRIAYLHAHLPRPSRPSCHAALTILARQLVVPIAASQQRLLDDHLLTCDDCRRAVRVIGDELASWSRATGTAAGVPVFRLAAITTRQPAPDGA